MKPNKQDPPESTAKTQLSSCAPSPETDTRPALIRRNQALMQNARENIHIMNEQGKLLEANDAFCHHLGYTLAEALRLGVSDWDAKMSADELRAVIVDALNGYVQFETVHRRKDGALIDVEVSMGGVELDGRRYLYATSRDITERKRAATLAQQFGSLLQSSFNEIYLFDADSLHFIQTSEGAKNNLGYSAEELLQLTPLDIKPSFTRERFEALLAPLRDGQQQTLLFETVHRRKDGTTYPVEIRLQFMPGTHPVFLAIIQDISARKRAEAELRIAAIAFETEEGVMVTDARSVILRVNRAFTRITGYTAEEAVGQTPSLLKSGRHDAAFYAATWESIKRSGVWQGEIWDRRKDGEVFPEHLTITAVKGDDGEVTHYVATLHDISERKLAEEQIYDLAFHDALTHLPNRRLLNDRLTQAMAASKRSGCYAALMFMDMDNFKPLNDAHGHGAGDLLLVEVARRIGACVREADTVARFGGDEFVVILSELDTGRAESAAQASIVAEKIRAALAQPYVLKPMHGDKAETTIEHRCTSSIGVVLFIDHEASAEDVLKWADMAMYRAKEAGRNLIRFYE